MIINTDQLMNLNDCRIRMGKIFLKIAQTPKDDGEIEAYLEAMDTHQSILSKIARGENIGSK